MERPSIDTVLTHDFLCESYDKKKKRGIFSIPIVVVVLETH
jgi:hypothetical protein